MRNHDFVSDGFLALIVAGLLLLCSILVVIGTSLAGPGALSPLLVRDEPTFACPSQDYAEPAFRITSEGPSEAEARADIIRSTPSPKSGRLQPPQTTSGDTP
jgi:hypothetical protein